MDNTVDSLLIKVEGDGQSAIKTLDKVVESLERIKHSGSGVSSVTSKLNGLKDTVEKLKPNKITKLSSAISSLNNKRVGTAGLKSLEAQARQSAARIETLKSSIHEMNNSFSDKPTALMQTLIDKENELEAAARRVSSYIRNTTPQPLAEKYTQQYESLRSQIEQISAKQLELQENGRAFLTEAQAHPEAFEKANEALSQEESKLAGINEELKKGSHSAKRFGSALKAALDNSLIGGFFSKLMNGIKTVGRIAVYRAIRSLIRQVTESFKTGIDDMYQYSKLFDGSFAQSMDRAASSALSFKNSIGAAVAPLIEMAVPVLDKIVDKLMEINNTAAMVFAGLAGKSTYSKAVRVTTEYAKAADDAGKNTGKVTDKVNELKRSLAGLDEITIIGQKLSDISSSAASDTDTGLDYGAMFVETPVDMAKVNEIKEKFNEILEIAKWIGAAILAWKLGSFIASLGTASSLLKGIALMVVGFSIEFAGAYDIGKNGLNWKNALATAIGGALGIAGSLIVFGTGPLGWTIGITAALTIGIVGYITGKMASGAELQKLTEDYKRVSDLNDRILSQMSVAEGAINGLDTAWANYTRTISDYTAVSVLVDEIFDLAEQSDLSKDKIAELQTKIDTLNNFRLDGLQLEFEESTSSILLIGTNADGTIEKVQTTRGEIQGLTEDLVEQAKTAALTELLTEAYKDYYAAALQQESVQENLNAAMQEYQTATENCMSAVYGAKGSIYGWITSAEKIGEMKKQVDKSSEALDNAKKTQEENNKALAESQATIDSVTSALMGLKTGAKGYADPITDSTGETKAATEKATASTKGWFKELRYFNSDSVISNYTGKAQDSTDKLKGKTDDAKQSIKELGQFTTGFERTSRNYASPAITATPYLSNSLNTATNDAYRLRNALSSIDGFSGSYSYTYSFGNIPQHAQGGFPEDGLFFANHNELVGQFSNGRTAVANNAQIVEGISEGVSSANEETNRLLTVLIGVCRQLLEKDSTIDVSTIISAFGRQNRRNGKATVPVTT